MECLVYPELIAKGKLATVKRFECLRLERSIFVIRSKRQHSNLFMVANVPYFSYHKPNIRLYKRSRRIELRATKEHLQSDRSANNLVRRLLN